MCRWFAYISPAETCLLSDVLIDPANAISKQCSDHYLPGLLPHGEEKELDDASDSLLKMRNSLLNMDGLGIAWYTEAATNFTKGLDGGRPCLYKTLQPPINDFNFKTICRNSESRCVLCHVRATSGSPVTPINSHPFTFGRHTFFHNGVVSNFTDIRRDLTDLLSYDNYANVLGTTDSEHVAALYMTYLGGGINAATQATWQNEYSLNDMKNALINAVITILKLQQSKLGDKKAPNSLNFCATDGKKMVATRFRNHETQQPPSLYWSEFAGRVLNSKYPGSSEQTDASNNNAVKDSQEHGKHTIIASEPTTYDESLWHLISRNSLLLVDEEGTETEEPLPYDASLNAVDPNAPK